MTFDENHKFAPRAHRYLRAALRLISWDVARSLTDNYTDVMRAAQRWCALTVSLYLPLVWRKSSKIYIGTPFKLSALNPNIACSDRRRRGGTILLINSYEERAG